jgi:micrococcal nuclease
MEVHTLLTFLFSLILGWFGTANIPVVVTPTTATTTAPVVSVIDGDTIIVRINGREETVRYIGVDTPEPRREGEPECGSHEATEFNRNLVEGQVVTLVSDSEDRDRYDRLLRYAYVDETFVNEELIVAGYATPLRIAPNTRHSSRFAAASAEAKTAGRGIFALCGT